MPIKMYTCTVTTVIPIQPIHGLSKYSTVLYCALSLYCKVLLLHYCMIMNVLLFLFLYIHHVPVRFSTIVPTILAWEVRRGTEYSTVERFVHHRNSIRLTRRPAIGPNFNFDLIIPDCTKTFLAVFGFASSANKIKEARTSSSP